MNCDQHASGPVGMKASAKRVRKYKPMTRHILVPLDGSSLAEAVLPCAAALARATSSALTLLRAVPPVTLIEPMGGPMGGPMYRGDAFWEAYQQEPDIARQYLAGVAASLESDGITVHTKVVDGDPAQCILEQASTNDDVNFIAMTTHGRSGLGRLFFGRVAENVLRASPVPVLMLCSREEDTENAALSSPARPYRNIMVPLDGSELAEKAIEQARALATGPDAGITLLSVAVGPSSQELADPTLFPLWVEASQDEKIGQLNEYLFGVAQQLRDGGLRVKTQVRSGDPAEEIMVESDRDNIDLIVMSTHGRGGLQRLWLGSVAMKVVQGANRPVLLVRAWKHPEETGTNDAGNQTETEVVGVPTG
jgi:nucleotide-binding universal stress UspA family protein